MDLRYEEAQVPIMDNNRMQSEEIVITICGRWDLELETRTSGQQTIKAKSKKGYVWRHVQIAVEIGNSKFWNDRKKLVIISD